MSYIPQVAISVNKWLEKRAFNQENCGLVNVSHIKDIYGIYVDIGKRLGYKGIMRKETATGVLLSSVPKSETPQGYLYCNQDGYIQYCKNYDSKNMMHTFRLLDMAIEILIKGEVVVKRPNLKELLSIRKGEWQYDDLIIAANQKMEKVEEVYQQSTLQDQPDERKIEALLVDLRRAFYEVD